MIFGNPDKVKALRKRYKWARDTRDSYRRPFWQDISKFISPAHGRFLDSRDSIPARGNVDRDSIINSSASRAKAIAVSGIKGGLVPHSLEWFKLSLFDEDMAKFKPVQEWLHQCERVMYGVFNRSNFYEAIYSPFEEQITFGTGPFQINEHDKMVIHCEPWTIGEYVLISGPDKTVDTTFRSYWMSARNIKKRWGYRNMSPHARNLLRNNPDAFIEVINHIYPREDYNPLKIDNLNMPWGSVWLEAKSAGDQALGESGYNSKPVMTPRWVVIGEDPYGPDCPAMEVLGDVKMLQRLERDKLMALAKSIDPPMNVPSTLYGRLKTYAGAQNIVSGQETERVQETFAVNYDIERIGNEIQRVEQRIANGFYNDLFLMLSGQERSGTTAFEIAKKHEEKLTLLGPVVERQSSELLTPIIERTFDICLRRGLIPPPPEEISDTEAEIKVEYVSLLAQAQRAVGVTAIERSIGFIGSMTETYPEIRYKVDPMKVATDYAQMLGMNPRLLRSDAEASKMYADQLQRESAQIQKEQQVNEMVQGAETAKLLGDTNPAVLDKLTQQLPAL